MRSAAPDHVLAGARRRGQPKFFLADSWGELLACSPELERDLLERSRRRLDEMLASGEAQSETAFEQLDPDTLLRVVPLPRGGSRYYAVFIEPVKDGVAAAIERFSVTKREAEVLEALMAGLSSPAIAKRLFITEATVGEHVKSLFRKTKTNKRSELVARIFRDLAGEADSPLIPTVRGM